MKRSRRVVLTMMGTAAAGAVSMGFIPRGRLRSGTRSGRDPRPGWAAARLLPCGVWRLWRRLVPISRPRPCAWRRLARVDATSSPASSATTGALPPKQAGFDFHTIDGERYWDERAYYAFTLEEIEREIEAPTGEIDAMCLELVGRAVDDETILRRLKIPEAFWPLISESWHRDEASLYGRLDLSFGGHGPAKLLEYNADTPTSIFEAAVFQWTWLEQAIERHIIPARADQFNSIHERLIEAWKKLGAGRHLHLDGSDREHRGCRHAGLSRRHRAAGRPCRPR